ncbi:hypothetical protein F2Q70_00033636 [Brassica cretica]|uniref:Uncharacterized protein n=1 Tax=Brassica cretica TaxID=69181 RepID=A0A8S9FEX3_BRACR|nr:hypothetical protein F2Q70_00033636 [Brassica cretica]
MSMSGEESNEAMGAGNLLGDQAFISSVLSSLPGVDPNDPAVQALLASLPDESKRNEEEESSSKGVPDPSSDVHDPRAAPTRDLFLVCDSIRQLASDDQGVPDQATKDVRDLIEATRSIPARVPFVSSSRLNSFGGPIQQSSKVKR